MVMNVAGNLLFGFEPESSFRFLVLVEDIPVGVFTECTLPTLEVKFAEEIREGGANSGITLPTHTSTTNLTLKKGLGMATDLYDWYKEVHDRKWVKAKRTVLVAMIGGVVARTPIAVWIFSGAMPVKWTGPTFKTSENVVAVETLELKFDDFEMMTEGQF